MSDNNIPLPPHSVEGEEALLGAILLDAAVDPSHMAFHESAKIISARDFFIVRNGWIYEAYAAILERSENIDPVSVCDELAAQGRLDDAGGPAYLTYLVNHTPSGAYVETYAEIIKRASIRRQTIKAAIQIMDLANNEAPSIEDFLGQVESIIHAVTFQASPLSDTEMQSAIYESFKYIERIFNGAGADVVATGFRDLDSILNGGLRQKELVVACGRPGQGKSAWALNVAQKSGVRVGIISFEMGALSLAQRYQAMTQGVPLSKLRTGDIDDVDWIKLSNSLDDQPAIWIEDKCQPTFSGVANVAARWKRLRGLDLLIVDHLHLMHHPGARSELEAYTHITKNLKRLAVDLDIPIILLSQLSREVENRKDKHPRLADLRASGSIEQDADIVIGVMRPETYEENSERINQMDCQVLKHRNGPTGLAVLYFHKELTKLSDIAGVTEVTLGDHFEIAYRDTFSARTHNEVD